MTLYYQQNTIARSVSCSGVGVHSGKKVNLTIKPAPVNYGIKFIRTDINNQQYINAIFNTVIDTSLATVIGQNGIIISTIEHLMASFSGLSIDNAIVELDSYEMPIMDGSADPFTCLIKKAGVQEQHSSRHFFIIKKPIKLNYNGKSVEIHPCSSFKLTCTIEYDNPLIRKQSYSIDLCAKTFINEISKARTFGFLHEVEYLKQRGLARGGSLDNAIVIDNNNVLNKNGLRYEDEFVRHKLLDCIGDFSLLGMPILGHIIAFKSGHALNHALLRECIANKDSWETRPIPTTY